MSEIAQRSEFLFLYDTRMANPNGDPDENRPRIDPYSGKNLVTEYRLKRTIRDYLYNAGKPIFIREDLKPDGSRKTIEELASNFITETTTEIKGEKNEQKAVDKDALIRGHIDVRLFGLLFAVGGIHFKQVGPVQFAIGRSLNVVQEIQVRNTRVVPTKEDVQGGTFGEKNILKYSLICFHGFLNQAVAKDVGLTEQDIKDMMEAMWYGTNNLSTTSKYGQISRLLVRVIYNEDRAYIGDLDKTLRLNKTSDLEDISQAGLDISAFLTLLENNRKVIRKVQYAVKDDLTVVMEGKEINADVMIKDWSSRSGVAVENLFPRD
ncbi:MAG: type I-B CRISPR-associated protein Cas7/Csh2 [Conexivisphaerales archaeon]